MPLPSYLTQLPNPFRSAFGPTWEGLPSSARKKTPSSGGDLLGLHIDSNPGLAALHSNLSTLAGIPRQSTSYTSSGALPSMEPSGGGYGGGHSMRPEFTMPGTGSPTIHGYTGGGIPTDIFSQLTGRAPTADDYYRLHNGQPTGIQIPSFPSAPAFKTGGPDDYDHAVASIGVAPTTPNPPPVPPFPVPEVPGGGPPSPYVSQAADGGMVQGGAPVLVGEKGPEVVVPNKDATVIPNHYLPMMYLMKGDIPNYLKSLQ